MYSVQTTQKIFENLLCYLKVFQSLTTTFVTMVQQDTGYSLYQESSINGHLFVQHLSGYFNTVVVLIAYNCIHRKGRQRCDSMN